MLQHEVLHPSQKGFMPHDGVTEHNFVLNHNITEARRNKTELCVAWLDLTNAFGSVPRKAILEALSASGIGNIFCDIVQDILSGTTTSAQTSEGTTEPITVTAGVKQGCLNLVPLNANKRSADGAIDRRCRRCGYETETLPHVLNHCMRNSRAYQSRHNNIVERISRAATAKGFSILSENQRVAGSNLRPDLVLVKRDACFIVDITVPFDNRLQAFTEARQSKVDKYSQLANSLRADFSTVSVEPIVVGSLGSWHNDNNRFVSRICSRKYAKLMRKLITSDTIRWSRDVYVEHLTGHRQYGDDAQEAEGNNEDDGDNTNLPQDDHATQTSDTIGVLPISIASPVASDLSENEVNA